MKSVTPAWLVEQARFGGLSFWRNEIVLRLFADSCFEFDCVPWVQMEGKEELTSVERKNLKKRIGITTDKEVAVVRYDEKRIFAKVSDLAICVYCHERSFK